MAGASYLEQVEEKIRDHLAWLRSDAAYQGKGCMEALRAFAQENDFDKDWEALSGAASDGMKRLFGRDRAPTRLDALVGGDTEFVVRAPSPASAKYQAYLDYVAEHQARDVVEKLAALLSGDYPDADLYQLMLEKREALLEIQHAGLRFSADPFLASIEQESQRVALLELCEQLHKRFLEGDNGLPELSARLANIERLGINITRGIEKAKNIAHYQLLASQQPWLGGVVGLICEAFPDLARSRDLVAALVSFSANKSAGDFILKDIYHELAAVEAKHGDALNYLSAGQLHMGFPEREAVYGAGYEEIRYRPSSADPDALGGNDYLGSQSHMAQRVDDVFRRITQQAEAIGGRLHWGRTHASVSLKAEDGENLSLDDQGEINLITRWMAGVLRFVASKMPERNPEAVVDVCWAPKRIDCFLMEEEGALMPGVLTTGSGTTHMEFRNVMTPTHFERLYPALAADGVDPYRFALLEVLGSMRYAVEMLPRIYSSLDDVGARCPAKTPGFEPALVDASVEAFFIDDSWPYTLYGDGELEGYIWVRSRSQDFGRCLQENLRDPVLGLEP